MGTRASFKQIDLEKAIRVAKEAGLSVAGFKINQDGEIDVRCGPPLPIDEFDMTDMRR
jgi:hypothetical protein